MLSFDEPIDHLAAKTVCCDKFTYFELASCKIYYLTPIVARPAVVGVATSDYGPNVSIYYKYAEINRCFSTRHVHFNLCKLLFC